LETNSSRGDVGDVQLNEASSIRVKIVESNGTQKVDVRLWIDSDRYSGPTKKGIRLESGKLIELLPLLQKAAQSIGA
jgi:hypothetical protein